MVSSLASSTPGFPGSTPCSPELMGLHLSLEPGPGSKYRRTNERDRDRIHTNERQARINQEHVHGTVAHTDMGSVFPTSGPTLPGCEV